MNLLTKLFQSRFKLAGTYLAIIMTMSILFSFAIYNISNNSLVYQRELEIPRSIRLSFIDEFEQLREQRLEQAQVNLRTRLIAFNLITLALGSIISYYLALRALRPIEEAAAAQDRFTSDASHEIRTPLTVMKSEIEVMLRDKNLTLSEAKQTLKSNLEEINRLEQLTEGLLQLARQENTAFAHEPIEAKSLIEDALSQVKPKAEKKHVDINFRLKSDFLFRGEKQSLSQAVVILLDNAIKYSPKNAHISIEAKNARTTYQIIINDEGPGIESTDLPHIFDRFYRSDTSRTREKTSGYGLGLSIAKEIIDQHGGAIHLSNKKPHGIKAVISLPKNP